jgi:hypothetical protein
VPEESTTPDLTELTRRGYEAVDRDGLDELMSFYASDVLSGAGLGNFEGAESVRDFFPPSPAPLAR